MRTGSGAPGPWTIWLTFAGFSLTAVAAGCVAAHVHGVSSRLVGLNLAAWGVGAGLAAVVSRAGRTPPAAWLSLAGVALMATLASPGLSGVHRWVALGPIRLNSAELMLPVAVVACAQLRAGALLRLLAPVVGAVILALQPDVSQAVALAGASVFLLLASGGSKIAKAAAAAGVAAAVVVAALRPDPLAPVPEVEGIVGLAHAASPLLAILAVAALAGAVLAPAMLARSSAPGARDASLALTVYLVFTALAPLVGAYPVPLVGMGVSPILGAWIGVGWVMHRRLDPSPGG